MKKNTNRYCYIGVYAKDSVYEPAEGGYYVPILRCISSTKMGFRHAKRLLRRLREEVQKYNDLLGYSNTSLYCEYYEYHIEKTPGAHEHFYHGYC